MESKGGWKIRTGKYHITYESYTKSKQPTRQSAQLPRADPALSPSTPVASSGDSGGGKMNALRKIIKVSKKQHKKVEKQPAIIRWVTDTVKSIVPSCLNKYFKKKNATEEVGAVPGTCQNCHSPPPPSPNNSELGPPRLDGPYYPEPSTSYTDVPTSKTASLPKLRSQEMDWANSRPHSYRYRRNRPAFNLSGLGKCSNSTLNRTALNSSEFGYSPSCPGKTTYGGRAVSRSPHRHPETPCQAPVRRPITAKPARAQPCGVTSNTARRILQSLESMSSPVAGAKKIPIRVPDPLSPFMDGTNLDASHSKPKKRKMVSNLPPVQKLIVPDAASVSGNSSVCFWPTSTPGGEGQNPTRQSAQLPMADPGPSHSTSGSSGPAYPLSSTPPASSGGEPANESETSSEEAPMLNFIIDKSSADIAPVRKRARWSTICFGVAGVPANTTSTTTHTFASQAHPNWRNGCRNFETCP